MEKSWPEKKLYFLSLTFHYQGVGIVPKLFPEISSWQRSAWDCGFLSVAFWQNPGAQLCVALHCCLVCSRCCIRNTQSQHHRPFETGSGPTEQVKEWSFGSFLSLILCGGFPCSCPEDVGAAAAHPCDRVVQITVWQIVLTAPVLL